MAIERSGCILQWVAGSGRKEVSRHRPEEWNGLALTHAAGLEASQLPKLIH